MDSSSKPRPRKGAGTFYKIVVRNELSERYAEAFEGMKMEVRSGQTILTGVVDQSHLHGILNRINGLGLTLVSAQAMPDRPEAEATEDRERK